MHASVLFLLVMAFLVAEVATTITTANSNSSNFPMKANRKKEIQRKTIFPRVSKLGQKRWFNDANIL